MKKILVPFDFSPVAFHALHFAADLAEISGGRVIALNVVDLTPRRLERLDPDDYTGDSMSILAELKREAARDFEPVREQMNRRAPVELHVETGILSQNVIKATHEFDADLVVMGTGGSNGLEELFIGSNAEKTVRNSPVPVFTVHKAQRIKDIRNLIFPVTFDPDQDRLVSKIAALQTFFRAHLHLLYVRTPGCVHTGRNLYGMLEAYARLYKLKNYNVSVTRAPEAEQGILKFASRIPYSVIAMATRGFTGLSHLLLGSVAENVVNHTGEAVWTYRLSEHL